ncbi:MAG TPA: anti-sigma factor [Ideonella sp.]|nr:anti-sigma factor [Ideonella sp.]
MSERDDPVTEDELHAFVDGQLELARLDAVLAWLGSHPDDAVRVAHWHAQRLQLRQLHRAVDAGAAPEAMAQTVLRAASPASARRPAWMQAAAAVLVLGVGLGLGTAGGRWSAAQQRSETLATAPPAFVRDAALAHAAFSPETRHPVEVAAAEEAHLVQWLSRRLGQPLKAPQLQDRGFRLLGGRLLPGDPSPRAQFMYEDARGRRVTLYVTVFPADKAPAETAFRAVHEGSLESFYWVESRFGYALAADLPSADLMALARDVYAQLSR